MTALKRLLDTSLGVSPDYRHVQKRVRPGEPLELPDALLKWYEAYPAQYPVSEIVLMSARDEEAVQRWLQARYHGEA